MKKKTKIEKRSSLPKFIVTVERWKQDPYSGLWASNTGKVTQEKTKRLATVRLSRHGYYTIKDYKTGKPLAVHTIVASAWLGNTEGATVDHLDGNIKNNNINNLEIVSKKTNLERAQEKMRNECNEEDVYAIVERALEHGVPQQLVWNAVNGLIAKHNLGKNKETNTTKQEFVKPNQETKQVREVKEEQAYSEPKRTVPPKFTSPEVSEYSRNYDWDSLDYVNKQRIKKIDRDAMLLLDTADVLDFVRSISQVKGTDAEIMKQINAIESSGRELFGLLWVRQHKLYKIQRKKRITRKYGE